MNEEGIIEGPPELVAEVSHSREAVDLGAKRADYQRTGVREYRSVCLREQALHWFDFRAGGELRPTRRGVYRSRVFPGLWIDGPALLAGETLRLLGAVEKGVAGRPHAGFVARLARQQRRRGSAG